jgi:hypothetical protein
VIIALGENNADAIGHNSFQLGQSLVGAVVSAMTLYPSALELQAEACRLLLRLCDDRSNWNVNWKGSWTGDSAGWADPLPPPRDRTGSHSGSISLDAPASVTATSPQSPAPSSVSTSVTSPNLATLSSPLKRERRSRRDRNGDSERGRRRSAMELADEAKKVAVDRGGVDAIVEAMRLHSEHATYFILACNILGSIAAKFHKESIVAKGVMECIRSALIVHPDSPDVTIHAARLLARLAKNSIVRRGLADPNTGSVSYWSTPAGDGLITLLCRSLTHWQTDAAVVSETMTFIVSLCSYAANIPIIVEKALGPVLDLIPLHPTSRSTLGLALLCCNMFTLPHARSLRLFRQDEDEEDDARREEEEEEKEEIEANNTKPVVVVPVLSPPSGEEKSAKDVRAGARGSRMRSRTRSQSRGGGDDTIDESSSNDTITLQPIYEEAVNDEQDSFDDEKDEKDIPHTICDCKVVLASALVKAHADDSVIQRW